MESLNVRRATRDDEPFLWLMLDYAAHLEEQGLGPAASKDVPALAKYVVGWGRPGDLGCVSVDSTHRRGIGTLVLQQLLAAADQKYSTVALKVRQSNPAVRLYERLGFRKVAGSEFVNRAGGVSFVMQIALEPERHPGPVEGTRR